MQEIKLMILFDDSFVPEGRSFAAAAVRNRRNKGTRRPSEFKRNSRDVGGAVMARDSLRQQKRGRSHIELRKPTFHTPLYPNKLWRPPAILAVGPPSVVVNKCKQVA